MFLISSALSQKQTFAVQKAMSALPSKADMCGATRDVGFGPEADMTMRSARIDGPARPEVTHIRAKTRGGAPFPSIRTSLRRTGSTLGVVERRWRRDVKAVCKLGLEGIVSRKLNAPYRSAPSKSWIKVKNPKAPASTIAIDGTF
jgi:hypothetical protein